MKLVLEAVEAVHHIRDVHVTLLSLLGLDDINSRTSMAGA